MNWILKNNQKIICTGSHKWYVKNAAGEVVRMKLSDMIKENITEILTKTDGLSAK